MIPLLLFLLGCVIVYVGTVLTAFGALMRLPLRLNAERHGHQDTLALYLEEPLRLFVPAALIQAVTVSLSTMLALLLFKEHGLGILWVVFVAVLVCVLTCAHLVPLFLVRGDPEHVLELVLPWFYKVAAPLHLLTGKFAGSLRGRRRERSEMEVGGNGIAAQANSNYLDTEVQSEIDEEELLHSVVEFGDTVVREVMTPRPDIVAIHATATLAELRERFVDEQYSRLPVHKEGLDDILGFVFVKDLVALSDEAGEDRVIDRLLRPAYVVPEAKRVAALLKEFQRQQVQIAVVHDEYGGTAGLVTVEDLLEKIVGEIRDEYDVETEPIVDERDGNFVFAGTVGVDDMTERLGIEIERQGFETVGGYLLSRLGRVPRVGEILVVDDLDVEILDAERRRVQRVRMCRRLEAVDVKPE